MRTGLGLLAFVAALALTACGSVSTVSVPAGIPANFGSILSALQSAKIETGDDLKGEERDVANGPSNLAGTCVNLAANVDYDVTTTIVHDRQNVIDEVDNLKAAITAVSQDITDWQKDVQAIANQGVPPPSGELEAISYARFQIQWATLKANDYINQTNSRVDHAYKIANAMAKGQCSPYGPGAAPGAIPLLS